MLQTPTLVSLNVHDTNSSGGGGGRRRKDVLNRCTASTESKTVPTPAGAAGTSFHPLQPTDKILTNQRREKTLTIQSDKPTQTEGVTFMDGSANAAR